MSIVKTFLPDSNGKIKENPDKTEEYRAKDYKFSISKFSDALKERREHKVVQIPPGIKQRFGIE